MKAWAKVTHTLMRVSNNKVKTWWKETTVCMLQKETLWLWLISINMICALFDWKGVTTHKLHYWITKQLGFEKYKKWARVDTCCSFNQTIILTFLWRVWFCRFCTNTFRNFFRNKILSKSWSMLRNDWTGDISENFPDDLNFSLRLPEWCWWNYVLFLTHQVTLGNASRSPQWKFWEGHFDS